MKVSNFIELCEHSGLKSLGDVEHVDAVVKSLISDLFFESRPRSVRADSILTSAFMELCGITVRDFTEPCVFITQLESPSEEEKGLTPRQFIEKKFRSFDIGIQFL